MSRRQEIRNWQKLIDCGELIDVSYEACSAGIVHPTAISAGAWSRYIDAGDGPVRRFIELERVQVTLSMLRYYLACGGLHGWGFTFHVPKVPDLIYLDVACSPRDDGTPVIIVQLPDANRRASDGGE